MAARQHGSDMFRSLPIAPCQNGRDRNEKHSTIAMGRQCLRDGLNSVDFTSDRNDGREANCDLLVGGQQSIGRDIRNHLWREVLVMRQQRAGSIAKRRVSSLTQSDFWRQRRNKAARDSRPSWTASSAGICNGHFSGGGLPIKENLTARDELVQQIKITDVTRQDGASELASLQVEESVMQKFPLMTLILWQPA
jgi:hypothetical protein